MFFTTTESLVTEDTDSSTDVYERSGGTTTLISTGTVGGNGPFGVGLNAVSATGSKAYMSTLERLTNEDDFAGEGDVYSRSSGGTLLVSVRNDPDLELGPPPPTLTKTEPGSPGESTETKLIGQAALGATIKIYTNSECSEAPVATGNAADLAAPGIAVIVAPHSTTSFWATAEAEGFVSPCPRAASPTHRKKRCLLRLLHHHLLLLLCRRKTERKKHRRRQKQKRLEKGLFQRRDHLRDAQTRVTFGPSFKTRKRRPVFRFIDATGQPGTTFLCRVDKHHWKPCASPLKLPRLGRGRHVLRIKGMNVIGVWETTAGKHRFKVVPR